MILFITDRGQCYWSEVESIHHPLYFGHPTEAKENCVIVTKILFVDGEEVKRYAVFHRYQKGQRFFPVVQR